MYTFYEYASGCSDILVRGSDRCISTSSNDDSNVLSSESSDVDMFEPPAPPVLAVSLVAQGNGMLGGIALGDVCYWRFIF